MFSIHPRPRRALASTLAASILTLPLISGASEVQAAQWKQFAPRGGGFSASFPGTPKGERKVEKENGSETIDQDYELETDTGLFKIGYQEHDASFARAVNVQNLLDEVVNAAMSEMGGAKNLKPKKITLNGFPGRDVTAKIDGGALRLRVFWAGRRMYMQMVGYTNGSSQADAARFIASLKLQKPQPK